MHRRQYCFQRAPGSETRNSLKAISSSPAWDSHSETWLRLLGSPQPPALCLQQPPSTLVDPRWIPKWQVVAPDNRPWETTLREGT